MNQNKNSMVDIKEIVKNHSKTFIKGIFRLKQNLYNKKIKNKNKVILI
jgi:hypothetical protein